MKPQTISDTSNKVTHTGHAFKLLKRSWHVPLFILCTILKFYDRKRFQHLQVFGSRKYVANSCLNNIPTKIGKSSPKVTCRNYNFTFRCLLLTATPIVEQNMNASPKKQQASVSYTSTGTPSWRHDHHGILFLIAFLWQTWLGILYGLPYSVFGEFHCHGLLLMGFRKQGYCFRRG